MSRPGYVEAARLAALGRTGDLLAALRGMTAPPQEIAAMLRAHHVSSLVRSALGNIRTSADIVPLLAALDGARPIPAATHAELRHGFDAARRRLEGDGIPVLLLKGQYLAQRLYQVPAWRPQFDIDLLVSARQHGRAVRALVSDGFLRTAYDLHSVTLTRGSLKIDLHRYLRWAPSYRIDEGAIWASSQHARIGELDARTLSDDYTLLLLVLGSFEDLGQGTTKLKQLLDLYLFLRELEPSVHWDRFFDRRQREGLADVAAAVIAVVVALFGAQDEMPALCSALARRGRPGDAAARQIALDLVFSQPKSPGNLAWFKRVYPGSLAHFLVWFWAAGFPANVSGGWAGRATRALGVAMARQPRA